MQRSALAAAILVALSGCTAATSADDPLADSASLAVSAQPTVETGSVTGVVMDDENRPVVGARVAIVETPTETSSDAEGRFTLNELPAGVFRIVAERLGYEGAAKRIEVQAGEVTEISLVLKPLTTVGDPYVRTHTGSVFIAVDWWYTAAYFYPLSDIGCNARCQIHHRIEPKPGGGLLESAWTPPVSGPVIAAAHSYRVIPNGYNGSISPTGDNGMVSTELENRGQFTFSEEGVKLFAKANRTLTHVGAGFESVSFQQRVDVWLTFSYFGPVPETFTALPPK